MYHKFLYIVVIFSFIALGCGIAYFSDTNDALKNYQKYGLIESNIHYEKVEKKWGQQGIIFYQLEFPSLKVPHHVEKMALSMNKHGITANLSNVHLNVNQAMQNLYPSHLKENLDTYTPYHDFFDKLLTSLAIMGIDEFVGDILVNTAYNDLKTMTLDIQVFQNKQVSIHISGVIHLPMVGTHSLTDLWKGKIEQLDIVIQNKKGLKEYINYIKSRKIPVSDALQRGIISLKNLTRKLPHLPNMMR